MGELNLLPWDRTSRDAEASSRSAYAGQQVVGDVAREITG